MICKFCNAELPEDVTLCPACGKENAQELSQMTVEETEELTLAAEEEAVEVIPEESAEAEETAVLEESAEAEETAALEENTEAEEIAVPTEAPKQKTKPWVVVLAVIGALAIAAVLGVAVYFGIQSSKGAADSYTVSDAQAEKTRDTVVATVGDVELTNSQLQVCYWQAINEFYNYYGSYIDSSVLDFNKPFDEQYYDAENGITWQQNFLEGALNSWSRHAALSMQGKEAGFTLDEEAVAYLESVPEQMEEMAVYYGYESAEAMLQDDMSKACDMDGYLAFLNNNFYAAQYMNSLNDTLVPTMEEIESYFQQHEEILSQQGIVNDGSKTVDVRHILICPKGGTVDDSGNATYSEAEWELCRQDAQKILDQWLAENGTEEDFAQYATMYTEDPGSMTTGGLYTDVYVGQMVEPFEDWCFDESRQVGDTGLVQTNYGYHIMYFVNAEEIWISNVRDVIINERSLAITEEAAAKWPMEVYDQKIVLGEVNMNAE